MKTCPEPSDPARAAFLRLSAAALGLGLAACAQAPYRGRRHRDFAAPTQESGLEESLAEFRFDLKLTPGQRPSWDRYARALRAFARDAGRERTRARTLADMTLRQRIDHQVQVARDRYAATEDIADAAHAFYATLDPAQRGVANPRLAGIVEMIAGTRQEEDCSPRTRHARARREDSGER